MEDDPRHDAAGVGPYPHRAGELKPMSELDDWEISEGSADIRGWQVVTLGGRELGRVEDLLVDADEHEVVMFTIDLKDTPRTARAPLRLAQVDRESKLVRLDSADVEGMTASDLAGVEHAADERDVLDRDDGREREEREGGPVERVVDRRPVVVEETVVRRRRIEPDSNEAREAPAKEALRRDKPGENIGP